MCNIENKVEVRIPGAEIKVGDIMQVWWFGKADKVRQIGDYHGPMTSAQGSRIAIFDNNRCGMEVLPALMYTVYRDPQPSPVPSDQIPETD